MHALNHAINQAKLSQDCDHDGSSSACSPTSVEVQYRGSAYANIPKSPRGVVRRNTSDVLLTTTPRSFTSTQVHRGGGSDGSAAGKGSIIKSNSIELYGQAATTGAVTAAMGYVYGKVLSATVKAVWQVKLSKIGADALGPYYIAAMCSVGGLLMGILSKALSPSYIVADFVKTLSGVGVAASGSGDKDRAIEDFPPLFPSLIHLLILSLVTSSFGFSVGPEAPMVCAGGLIGASMARMWSKKESNNEHHRLGEILSYCGASGSLTAFMGIPLAGPIFALELTRASSGMNELATADALGPSIAASAAALLLIRGILLSTKTIGGHFTYSSALGLTGGAAMLTSVICGITGAAIGTVFHKLVHALKHQLWNPKRKTRPVLVKTLIGICVGFLSMSFPQTMFWGEGSLQTAIDGHMTAFSATKHGLDSALTAAAKVNPSIPFASASAAMQVGIAKLLAIALACAGKFPGGIIFPLFFASAPMAHSVLMLLGSAIPQGVRPVAIMSLMASTQASVTRTPLATIFMLALSASASTHLSIILPSVIISSYIGVWFSRYLSSESYFEYSS